MERPQDTSGGPSADRSARFIELLGPHRAALERFARLALHAPDEVEDALQSALLQAFRGFPGFTEGTNFRAFLFAHVANEVRNANRRRRGRPAALEQDSPAGGEDILATLEKESAYDAVLSHPERVFPHVAEEIVRAVRDLPEAERAAFLLRSIAGLKYAEIGRLLEIPLGTALTRLHNARARLRRALADYALAHGIIRPGAGTGSGGPRP